jgi:hypothetical protein
MKSVRVCEEGAGVPGMCVQRVRGHVLSFTASSSTKHCN